MTEGKLAEEQTGQIIGIMSQIKDRTVGDTDEFVEVTGLEIDGLLTALGINSDANIRQALQQPDWSLPLREDWFLGSSEPKEVLARGIRVATLLQVVLQTRDKRRYM